MGSYYETTRQDKIMDPINILVLFNLIAVFGANLTGAKKGFKAAITDYKEKPKSYLQQVPLTLAAISTLVLILGIFKVGVIDYSQDFYIIRIVALVVYIVFSWVQVLAFKTLGDNYAQEVLIFKNHKLVQKGIYKFFRHPQYISQILMDLAAAAAVLSYLLAGLALIELPLLVLRASMESKMLARHFKNEYPEYKKRTLF